MSHIYLLLCLCVFSCGVVSCSKTPVASPSAGSQAPVETSLPPTSGSSAAPSQPKAVPSLVADEEAKRLQAERERLILEEKLRLEDEAATRAGTRYGMDGSSSGAGRSGGSYGPPSVPSPSDSSGSEPPRAVPDPMVIPK